MKTKTNLKTNNKHTHIDCESIWWRVLKVSSYVGHVDKLSRLLVSWSESWRLRKQKRRHIFAGEIVCRQDHTKLRHGPSLRGAEFETELCHKRFPFFYFLVDPKLFNSWCLCMHKCVCGFYFFSFFLLGSEIFGDVNLLYIAQF